MPKRNPSAHIGAGKSRPALRPFNVATMGDHMRIIYRFSDCSLAQSVSNIGFVTESYRCWAEVDLTALRQNLSRIRAIVGPEKKILTVVKADAYGHGLRQTAAVLMQSGTDMFGVANLAEAQAIRSVGKGWPILMLGACLPAEIDAAVRDSITPTLSTLEEGNRFSRSAQSAGKVIAVQLKIDTGMGRLGVFPGQAQQLLGQLEKLPGIRIQGVYTHFSSVEDDPDFTNQQSKAFAEFLQTAQDHAKRFDWIHTQNSGGTLLESSAFCNAVRPGLLVYGIVPPGSRTVDSSRANAFSPALSWHCRVSLVRELSAGTPVSYGHTYVARSSMRVATITAGYGDGYLRAASNRANVLINGSLCPIIGRVTMDQMVADISGANHVREGDEVVLLGKQGAGQITAAQLASWCDTIPWEILTNITYRVPRIYRGGHAA